MADNATATDREADVIVIGLGPGGEAAAGQLAEAGLAVIGIEASLVGGECPYWGCVPSKMMIRAANALAEARRIEGLAGTSSVEPDWNPVASRIRDQATDDWDDTVAVDRFVGKGGIFIRGKAKITGSGTVEVGDQTYRATKGLIIATGTLAAVPPIPGLADTPFWTNHHAIETKELPQSMVVLGGGAIGLEIGQAMARFGVEVTIVEAMDRILPRNEPEASESLTAAFGAEGIRVKTGQMATSVAHHRDQGHGRFEVTLADGSTVSGEKLLVATGRRTFLDELGVANLGLDPAQPYLSTHGNQRVTDGLWAVGDITGDGLFTHLAIRQASIAAADILGIPSEPLNLDALSAVTFTDPEVGSVGHTEAEAIELGLTVTTVTKPVGHTARGWLHGAEGVIKIVIDTDRQIVVGATSVGPAGGEVLGLLALAVHAKIPLSTLRSMIYAYPTFHKGIEDALNDLG